jgi:hypothetical protein
MWVLGLVIFIDQVDQNILRGVVTPLKQDLGIGDLQIGILLTAYTIVNGHKLTLGLRDLVLTPNGTWHDHGVDEDGEISMWQDGLIPSNALEANSMPSIPTCSRNPIIR